MASATAWFCPVWASATARFCPIRAGATAWFCLIRASATAWFCPIRAGAIALSLAGLPQPQIKRLLVVQNPGARVVVRPRKPDHISPTPRELLILSASAWPHLLLLWTPHLEFTPQDLRLCSTPSCFKAKLKTFL